MQDAFSAITIHHSRNSPNQDMLARTIQSRAASSIEIAGIKQGNLISVVLLNMAYINVVPVEDNIQHTRHHPCVLPRQPNNTRDMRPK
jgi:hypothetical protein